MVRTFQQLTTDATWVLSRALCGRLFICLGWCAFIASLLQLQANIYTYMEILLAFPQSVCSATSAVVASRQAVDSVSALLWHCILFSLPHACRLSVEISRFATISRTKQQFDGWATVQFTVNVRTVWTCFKINAEHLFSPQTLNAN